MSVTIDGTGTVTGLSTGGLPDGSIAAADLADDAVTLAKMATGTDGNIISYDASGNPVAIATGSDGQVLTSAGAGAPPAFEAAAGITTVSTLATTSGASVDFTSIPAGTVAIDVIFSKCSLSIGGNIVLQLGDSGGIETSGYLNSCVIHSSGSGGATQDSTAWIQLVHSNIGGASSSHPGIVSLRLVNPATHTWIASGQILNLLSGALSNYSIQTTTAFKSLSAALTTIRLTNTNTGAGCVFDEGEATIQYH